MKLSRKLIPAFAMLLVSAVLMSTASFAWFSMNENVTATGISVTATAPAALWISTDASNWQTTIDMSETLIDGTAAQVAPLTTYYTVTPGETEDDDPTYTYENGISNFNEWKFYGLTSAAGKKVLSNGAIGVQDTAGNITEEALVFPQDVTQENGKTANLELDSGANYYKTVFYLRYEGETGAKTNVNVDLKVTQNDTTGVTDAIWQAMRVALVANNLGTPVIFTPATLGSYTTTAQTLFEITANTNTQVAVYIWFEGTDEHCANKYSASENIWDIELKFS